jgi:hypothetical protein
MYPDLVRYAVLSDAAYQVSVDQVALHDAVEGQGMELISCCVVDGFAAFACEDADSVSIIVQGTRDRQEFLADAEILVVRLEDSRLPESHLVHAGGHQVWMDIRSWALQVPHEGKQLKAGGHSLGGMVAHYIAAVMPVVEIYTYGSPRAGLSAFARAFNALPLKSTRVVHDLDIIPTVPGLPYEHVNGLLNLHDDGTPAPITDGTDPGILRRAKQVLADFDGQAERDHHSETYIDVCTRYVTSSVPSKGF